MCGGGWITGSPSRQHRGSLKTEVGMVRGLKIPGQEANHELWMISRNTRAERILLLHSFSQMMLIVETKAFSSSEERP